MAPPRKNLAAAAAAAAAAAIEEEKFFVRTMTRDADGRKVGGIGAEVAKNAIVAFAARSEFA
jgi:hypothetical protein